MGIFSTLHVGASGMRVNESAMSIVGDNIANMNTVGFKANRGVFTDVFHKTIYGTGGPSQMGLGAGVAGVQRMHQQGALLGTGVTTDLAIGGSGFFIVEGEALGGEGRFYTRNGQFHIDADGKLVDIADRKLQGFTASASGDLSSRLDDLVIAPRQSPPVATAEAGVDMNLSFDQADGTPITDFDSLLGEAGTPEEPQGDYKSTIEVIDAAGEVHSVDLYFDRQADGSWNWRALVDSADIDGGDPTGFTQVGGGAMAFSDGALDPTTATAELDLAFNGVSGQTVALDFTGTTSVAGPSSTNAVNVDGRVAGDFQSLSFEADGSMMGTYTNGATRLLGKLALAEFVNPSGLEAIGENLYKISETAGDAVVGTPNSSSRGQLFGGALESSSVDLTDEFTRMIVAQRGFQASSRTITTADAMLTEVVNLKR